MLIDSSKAYGTSSGMKGPASAGEIDNLHVKFGLKIRPPEEVINMAGQIQEAIKAPCSNLFTDFLTYKMTSDLAISFKGYQDHLNRSVGQITEFYEAVEHLLPDIGETSPRQLTEACCNLPLAISVPASHTVSLRRIPLGRRIAKASRNYPASVHDHDMISTRY